MTNETKQSQFNRKVKRFFLFCLVAAASAALIVAAQDFQLQKILITALTWIDNLGFWKPIAFIIIYNVATVLFIPGSILTLSGGLFFGVVWGSVYVFIAATLGASTAFLIGRYLSRGWVLKQIEGNPKFKAIDDAVARDGFKIVLLTRLSPLFPFNLLNYTFGLTKVSWRDYFLGSLGTIPGIIMYVYLGSLASDLAALSPATMPANPQAEAANWVMRAIGCISTVAVTVYSGALAKKALETKI